MFKAAVTKAVAHIVNQTSEEPPKFLVKLLVSSAAPAQSRFLPTASRRQMTRRNRNYCNFAYSAWACFRMGM
jgi:hypothetical protein